MQHIKEIEFLDLLCNYSNIINHVAQLYGHDDEHYVSELKQEITIVLWIHYNRFGKLNHKKNYTDTAYLTNLAIKTAISYCRHYYYPDRYTPFHEGSPQQKSINNQEEQPQSRIEEIISTLTIKDQRLITYYLNKFSYAQIADFERMTESAVGTRISRIIQKLKIKYNH